MSLVDATNAKRPLLETSVATLTPLKILALHGLFLGSGLAALAYEVAWVRRFTLFFGSTAAAQAAILALFLTALAIGAMLFGARAPSPRPLRLYGLLEMGAGLLALGVPFVLPLCERAQPGDLVRGVCSALLIMPPTIALGGTLPVLAGALPSDGKAGARLAWLYASNTLGACAGALVFPLVLLPALGQLGALLAIPGLSVLIGVGAVAMPWPPLSPATERAASSETVTSLGDLLLALLSGALVVTLEVGAARLIALGVSQSIYGFAIMLFACIGGLALGAYAAGRLVRLRCASLGLPVALVLGGAGVAMLPALLGALPRWLAVETPGAQAPFGSWILQHAVSAFVVMLPATLGLGILFPVLLGRAGTRARAVGRLYAANAVGAVAGSYGASFVLMPLLGPRYLLVAVACVALVAGFAVVLARRSAPRWLLLPAMVAAAFLGQPADSGSEWYLRSPAVYREAAAFDRAARTIELVAHDAHATIAVGLRTAPGEPPYRFFSVNGKIDGGESELDMATQLQLAMWPLVLHQRPRAERALVIGLGTGATVGEALRFPVTKVDVVEISKPVVSVARDSFARINRAALSDPRVTVHVTDGRRFLDGALEPYDVMISEPSNPWIAGIGALYTVEAFTRMREHLCDGGVVCQWVQAYELTEDLFRTIVATFAAVFPDCFVVMPHARGFDVLLLGIKAPAAQLLSTHRIEAAMRAREPVSPDIDFTPHDLEALASHFLMGPRSVARYVAGAILNTDDNALLELSAPKAMLERAAGFPSFVRLEPLIEPCTGYLDASEPNAPLIDAARSGALAWRLLLAADLRVAVLREMAALPWAARQRALDLIGTFERDVGASTLGHHVQGLLVQFASAGDLAMRFASGWRRSESAELLARAVRDAEPGQLARLDLGELLERNEAGERYANGADPVGAARQYEAILAHQPRHARALLSLAELLIRQGRQSEALSRLAAECEQSDGDADVAVCASLLHAQLGQLDAARVLAERVGMLHPRHVGLLRVRAQLSRRAGELARARSLLESALDLSPDDQNVARELDALGGP